MMKQFYTLLILALFSISAQAQCTIDSLQTTPGIYPDTLSPATVNQYYSQDITFVMITDTLGITITNFNIASITGLPVGMNWQCNNASNGCNYNPAASIYGCINLSGTPLIAGTYNATVTIVVTLQILGNQTISYSLPFIVVPDTVSNPGFAMTNSTGCAPLTVSFLNNDPGQAAYQWDFGNGIQSSLENPPSQTYNTPGNYVVTQTVTANGSPQYFLTDITVASIPDNYGAPLDVPDMYFYIYDPQGNQIYDSHPSISNTNPPYTYNLPNIPLQNGNYTIHVWDEDGGLFGADDDLGSVSFAGWGNSGTATGTLSGVSGSLVVNYSILNIPVPTYSYSDTIHVYASPSVPVVTAGGALVFCEGDTVVLSCNDTNSIQWYESGNLLLGQTQTDLIVNTTGNYTAVVTNANGCTAESAVIAVTVNPNPPKPTFFVNGNTLNCVLTGYMLQWYYNSVAIAGETSLVLNATQQGTYYVVATDSLTGCSTTSDPLLFTPVGIKESDQVTFSAQLSPNPASDMAMLTLWANAQNTIQVSVMDISGKVIWKNTVITQKGITQLPIDL
jgi:PKD repeat protein